VPSLVTIWCLQLSSQSPGSRPQLTTGSAH
jgi:hypothetical protein